MESGAEGEKPVNKKMIAVGAVFLLLVFLPVYAKYSGGAGREAEKEPPAQKTVAVKIAAVVRGTVNPALTMSGSVAGDREVVLTAKTQGAVTGLNARAGQRVAAGQVLVVLESDNQQLTAEKAREQVDAAALALEKARADFIRIAELHRQGALSRADFEKAELMLKNAQAAYNVALSDSQLAGQLLKDTIVKAPFPGSVGECFVEEGETVFPGTKLMTVVDDSGLKIKAGVTAGQLKLVSVGQRGLFTTNVHPGREFPCTVRTVGSRASPGNLTYAVELGLSGDAAGHLKPGMFGNVKLETAGAEGVIFPREALVAREEAGEAEVFVVRDGRSVKKKIMTGLSDEKNILAHSGLEPGDRVVVFGQSLLKDGTLVVEGE